ncbi:CU044_2847 family protein [Streptomyces sp. NPDC006465]|uniref:CU044_2847 family protein n=1 Tax=Streptomyces sp. NPDC006465 TaxID=3157174 RepID=UPI0033A77819
MTDDIATGARLVEIELPNGATGLVRVREFDGSGARKVGWEDRFDFTGVAETLEGVADALRTSLSRARPNKVTVELGVELAIKSGKLTGLLVEGEGKGALNVTLEWEGEH